jgi:hypothetical protein
MACLECGLEQAVADAETCARCGAALSGAGSWAGTFTGPGGQELWVDGSGIHLRGTRNAPARLISCDEIVWFRDGWDEPGWMLHIVLVGGRVEKVTPGSTMTRPANRGSASGARPSGRPSFRSIPAPAGTLARRRDWRGYGHRCPQRSCTATRAPS